MIHIDKQWILFLNNNFCGSVTAVEIFGSIMMGNTIVPDVPVGLPAAPLPGLTSKINKLWDTTVVAASILKDGCDQMNLNCYSHRLVINAVDDIIISFETVISRNVCSCYHSKQLFLIDNHGTVHLQSGI